MDELLEVPPPPPPFDMHDVKMPRREKKVKKKNTIAQESMEFKEEEDEQATAKLGKTKTKGKKSSKTKTKQEYLFEDVPPPLPPMPDDASVPKKVKSKSKAKQLKMLKTKYKQFLEKTKSSPKKRKSGEESHEEKEEAPPLPPFDDDMLESTSIPPPPPPMDFDMQLEGEEEEEDLSPPPPPPPPPLDAEIFESSVREPLSPEEKLSPGQDGDFGALLQDIQRRRVPSDAAQSSHSHDRGQNEDSFLGEASTPHVLAAPTPPPAPMQGVLEAIRRNRVPSSVNPTEALVLEHDEKMEDTFQQIRQRRVPSVNTKPAVEYTDNHVEKEEGMKDVFAQIRRNRVPSFANTSILAEDVKPSQQLETQSQSQKREDHESTAEEEEQAEEEGGEEIPPRPSNMMKVFEDIRRNRTPSEPIRNKEAVISHVVPEPSELTENKQAENSHDVPEPSPPTISPPSPPHDLHDALQEGDELDLNVLLNDATFEKYARMLRAGIPPPALIHKMGLDGVDPPFARSAEEPTAQELPSSAEPDTQVEKESTELRHSVDGASVPIEWAKYERMLKCGIPEGAVRQKMFQDGIDPPDHFFSTLSRGEDRAPLTQQETTHVQELEENEFVDEVSQIADVSSQAEEEQVPLESEPITTGQESSAKQRPERRLSRLRRLSLQRSSSRLLQDQEAETETEEVQSIVESEPAALISDHEQDQNQHQEQPTRDVSEEQEGDTSPTPTSSFGIEEFFPMPTSSMHVEESSHEDVQVEAEQHLPHLDESLVETNTQERMASAEKSSDLHEQLQENEQRDEGILAEPETGDQDKVEAERKEMEEKSIPLALKIEDTTPTHEFEVSEKKDIEAAQEEVKLEDPEAKAMEEEQRLIESFRAEIDMALDSRMQKETAEAMKECQSVNKRLQKLLENLIANEEGGEEQAEAFFQQASCRFYLASRRLEILEREFQEAESGLDQISKRTTFVRKSSLGQKRSCFDVEKILVELEQRCNSLEVECDRLDDSIANNQMESSALDGELKQLQGALEEERATLAEEKVRKHLERLYYSSLIQATSHREQVKALQKQRNLLLKQLEEASEHNKAIYDEQYAKVVTPVLQREKARWEKLLAKENQTHAERMEAIMENREKAKDAFKKATDQKFSCAFSEVLSSLGAEEKSIQNQIDKVAEEKRVLSRRLEQLTKEQQSLGQLSGDSSVSITRVIQGKKAQEAENQRRLLDHFHEKIEESWRKMESLGLGDQVAKHKLSFLYKVEQAVPFSPHVLQVYQKKIEELEDALPIFRALKERDGLARSVELCRGFVKEFDMSAEGSHEQVREVMQMLKRESHSLEQVTIRCAKLVESWEQKYGQRFHF